MLLGDKLRAVHRADPLFFWCFTGLLVAIGVPLWSAEFLPLLDIPQHLATIGVMHHHDDPEFAFGAFFTIESGSTQYLLYYLTCDVLSTFSDVETANRIFLTLYTLLLPVSVLYALSAFGRLKYAALLAFPLVYNKFLFYGFVNYVFAFPFLFFGLGLLKRALDADATSKKREVLLLLTSLMVFYSHLQVFLIYIGGLGLVVLLGWPGFRRATVRLLHVVPALVLFAMWGLQSDGMAGGEAWKNTVSQRYESLTGAEWEPMWKTMGDIHQRFLSVYHSDVDEKTTMAWIVGVLVLMMLRRVGQPAEASRRKLIAGFAPEVLTLFVVLFYFAVPTSYKWIWPVNWRFVPLVGLLLLLWARADLGRWSGAVLTVLFSIVSAYSIYNHIREFRAFDAEAQDVKPILAEIAPQSRVLGLTFDANSEIVDGPVYLHFVQYHQIRKGGVSVYSFAEAPQSPIRFRSRDDGGPPPTPLRSEWKANEFRFNNDARYYDYFLVRGERGGFARRVGFGTEVKRVAKNGKWSLYHYDRR
jgi:hypothetical protein